MSSSNTPIDSEWFAELKRDAALGKQLVAILLNHCGEHGETEGAVETLNRIISERGRYVPSEVSELHAALEHSMANTDRGLAQFETLAETVAVWCESLAAGTQAPAEVWAERALALRAGVKESRAIEGEAGSDISNGD